MNLKKVYRIYKEMGLQLRNKLPERQVKENCMKTAAMQFIRMMSRPCILHMINLPQVSFNGNFRDECLNEILFSTLSEAQTKIKA